jgi:hypothetical protein
MEVVRQAAPSLPVRKKGKAKANGKANGTNVPAPAAAPVEPAPAPPVASPGPRTDPTTSAAAAGPAPAPVRPDSSAVTHKFNTSTTSFPIHADGVGSPDKAQLTHSLACA